MILTIHVGTEDVECFQYANGRLFEPFTKMNQKGKIVFYKPWSQKHNLTSLLLSLYSMGWKYREDVHIYLSLGSKNIATLQLVDV